MNDVSVDIGQSKIPALVSVGQTPVIDAQQMKDRCVKVVDVHGPRRPLFLTRSRPQNIAVLIRDVVAVVVGAAVRDAGLYASAGHPGCKASRVMITTVVGRRQLPLAVCRTAEFAAPNHERVVEHAQSLEVLDQGRTSLVNILALIGVFAV